MIAARPDRPVPVPVALRSHTTGAEVDTVWVNEIGGVTWELRAAGRHQFAKWQPARAGIPLSVEADRLRWAGRHTPVPAVVESWDDADGSWLITEALQRSQEAFAGHGHCALHYLLIVQLLILILLAVHQRSLFP